MTIAFGWLIGWVTDTSRDLQESATDQQIVDSSDLVGGLLHGVGDIDQSSFVDEKIRTKVGEVIRAQWMRAISRSAESLATKPFEEAYRELLANKAEYDACREEYVRITRACSSSLSQIYARQDHNLQVLGRISAEIREEAIVPSFSMFEERRREVLGELDKVRSIEFA